MTATPFMHRQKSVRNYVMNKFEPLLVARGKWCSVALTAHFRPFALLLSFILFYLSVTGMAWGAGSEFTVMLPGDVPLVLVKVPAGTFPMGSPDGERGSDFFDNETQHQVTLTQDYYIGKTEVTQQQWMAVMGTAMPTSCGDAGMGDDFPAYCVTWKNLADAGGFMEKLNQLLGTQGFRLPTEAEWERAARAGTTTRFSHGDVLECSDECGACAAHDQFMAWCGNSSNATKPVGSKQANPFGLHDMHGNLWEFVQDRYGEYSSAAVTDPTGPATGNDRVIRGGDWGGDAQFSRSASRVSANPGDPGIEAANTGVGFRIATSTLDGLGFPINAGLNGNWYGGSDRNGEGIQIEISAGDGSNLVLIATFYSYDTLGNQIFMIMVGPVNGDTAEVKVYITDNGQWGGNFDPLLVEETQWGTGTIRAFSCEAMEMDLRPNDEYKALGYTDLLMYGLIRLPGIVSVAPCPIANPN